MGILKKGETKEQLSKSVHDLFTRCLGIPLTINDIHIEKGKKGKYAYIDLKSEENVETACDLLGSPERGEVVGIECDHKKEDKIRLKIDQTINTIIPAIFSQNYQVHFVPVYYNYKNGQVKGNFKVIEIEIVKLPHNIPPELYHAGGDVYVRQDGGMRRLNQAQIQQWKEQRKNSALQRDHEEELQNARTKLEELKAEVNSLQTERNSALNKMVELETEKNTLQRDKSAIRRERSTLQKEVELQQKKIHDLEKRKKSKVCVVL